MPHSCLMWNATIAIVYVIRRHIEQAFRKKKNQVLTDTGKDAYDSNLNQVL